MEEHPDGDRHLVQQSEELQVRVCVLLAMMIHTDKINWIIRTLITLKIQGTQCYIEHL